MAPSASSVASATATTPPPVRTTPPVCAATHSFQHQAPPLNHSASLSFIPSEHRRPHTRTRELRSSPLTGPPASIPEHEYEHADADAAVGAPARPRYRPSRISTGDIPCRPASSYSSAGLRSRRSVFTDCNLAEVVPIAPQSAPSTRRPVTGAHISAVVPFSSSRLAKAPANARSLSRGAYPPALDLSETQPFHPLSLPPSSPSSSSSPPHSTPSSSTASPSSSLSMSSPLSSSPSPTATQNARARSRLSTGDIQEHWLSTVPPPLFSRYSVQATGVVMPVRANPHARTTLSRASTLARRRSVASQASMGDDALAEREGGLPGASAAVQRRMRESAESRPRSRSRERARPRAHTAAPALAALPVTSPARTRTPSPASSTTLGSIGTLSTLSSSNSTPATLSSPTHHFAAFHARGWKVTLYEAVHTHDMPCEGKGAGRWWSGRRRAKRVAPHCRPSSSSATSEETLPQSKVYAGAGKGEGELRATRKVAVARGVWSKVAAVLSGPRRPEKPTGEVGQGA